VRRTTRERIGKNLFPVHRKATTCPRGHVEEYAGWDELFSSGHGAPDYLGLSTADAEVEAATKGVTTVRVADLDIEPKIILTFDLRLDRLTLVLDHGHVVRSGFF
jgi:hypothetical protein